MLTAVEGQFQGSKLLGRGPEKNVWKQGIEIAANAAMNYRISTFRNTKSTAMDGLMCQKIGLMIQEALNIFLAIQTLKKFSCDE